jgi:hypothetical protein
MWIVTSVRDKDRVFRCDPEVLRDGFGRIEDDMFGWVVG